MSIYQFSKGKISLSPVAYQGLIESIIEFNYYDETVYLSNDKHSCDRHFRVRNLIYGHCWADASRYSPEEKTLFFSIGTKYPSYYVDFCRLVAYYKDIDTVDRFTSYSELAWNNDNTLDYYDLYEVKPGAFKYLQAVGKEQDLDKLLEKEAWKSVSLLAEKIIMEEESSDIHIVGREGETFTIFSWSLPDEIASMEKKEFDQYKLRAGGAIIYWERKGVNSDSEDSPWCRGWMGYELQEWIDTMKLYM